MAEEQEWEWGDEWYALPWDDDEYEPSEEKEWGRVAWVDDMLIATT